LAEVGSTRKMLIVALSGLFFSRGCMYTTEAEKENEYVWALAAGHTLQAVHRIISSCFHCLGKCIGLDI